MTREQIEKKAAEKFPTEPFRAFSDDYSRKMYCQRKDQQQAYIEGALMVVESQSNGAIPYESLSEGMRLSIDSIESSIQCKTFEKDKYTSYYTM
jgi:hypothetical protein